MSSGLLQKYTRICRGYSERIWFVMLIPHLHTTYYILHTNYVVHREKERGPEGSERKKIFLDLHQPIPFSTKPELIYVFDVDKNGGKIWEFWFLKKVLKLDFPKVYFFGSLRKSLFPINENPNFAAIFHKTNWNVLICSTCRKYMPWCFAPRRDRGPTARAEGPTITKQSLFIFSWFIFL